MTLSSAKSLSLTQYLSLLQRSHRPRVKPIRQMTSSTAIVMVIFIVRKNSLKKSSLSTKLLVERGCHSRKLVQTGEKSNPSKNETSKKVTTWDKKRETSQLTKKMFTYQTKNI